MGRNKMLCNHLQPKPIELGLSAMGVLAAGLDARAAAIVMRSVRNIVSTGRTIVCEPPFIRFTLRPWLGLITLV